HRPGADRPRRHPRRAGRHGVGRWARPAHQRRAGRHRAPPVRLAPRTDGGRPVTARRLSRSALGGAIGRWVLLVLMVAVWDVGARAADDPHFPPPTRILGHMRDLWFSGP